MGTDVREEYKFVYKRSRSVVRDGKILMERVVYFGREFFSVPGGGIEEGETPVQASSENPPLKEVLWMSLDEISKKDRAFLWSYGLLTMHPFFEEVKSWGGEISYPGHTR